jgi:hypothetical protein
MNTKDNQDCNQGIYNQLDAFRVYAPSNITEKEFIEYNQQLEEIEREQRIRNELIPESPYYNISRFIK